MTDESVERDNHCNLCHRTTTFRLNKSGIYECEECGAFLPEKVVQMEREWIAVRGERIVAKADTQERAAVVAEQLGETYEQVVAVPKGGAPSGPF